MINIRGHFYETNSSSSDGYGAYVEEYDEGPQHSSYFQRVTIRAKLNKSVTDEEEDKLLKILDKNEKEFIADAEQNWLCDLYADADIDIDEWGLDNDDIFVMRFQCDRRIHMEDWDSATWTLTTNNPYTDEGFPEKIDGNYPDISKLKDRLNNSLAILFKNTGFSAEVEYAYADAIDYIKADQIEDYAE